MERISTGLTCAILTFVVGLGLAKVGVPAKPRGAKTASVGTIVPCSQPTSQPTPQPTPVPAAIDADPASHTDEAQKVMRPHSVSISPYEIKRLIDENNRLGENSVLDLEPIWKQLGIPHSEFAPSECDGHDSCKAAIATFELEAKPGKQTLLRIGSSNTQSDRYLIFERKAIGRSANRPWRILGCIEAYVWLSDSNYRIMSAGTQRWLAVEQVTGHGAGYGSSGETWYEVSENGVMPVLSYQSSLYLYGWETRPSTETSTRVSAIESNNRITTVVLNTSTIHKDSKADYFLWANKRKATFIKGPSMQEFCFDPLHSEISEKEVDLQFGDEVLLTEQEFLQYNYPDLVKIALGGDVKRKDWLRRYLRTCGDSIQKRSLQNALERARP